MGFDFTPTPKPIDTVCRVLRWLADELQYFTNGRKPFVFTRVKGIRPYEALGVLFVSTRDTENGNTALVTASEMHGVRPDSESFKVACALTKFALRKVDGLIARAKDRNNNDDND